MSTLSIAPQTVRSDRTDREVRSRSVRPLPVTPSFDFGTPVPALGADDPAVRVLPAPRVPAPTQPRDQASVVPLVQVAAPTRSGSSSVRLTRRGRLTVTLTFLGLVLAAMVAVGSTWATASLGAGEPEVARVVVVQPGDTLYGIAASVAEPGEVREAVHRIQELNSLPSATIAEGQELAVPRG